MDFIQIARMILRRDPRLNRDDLVIFCFYLLVIITMITTLAYFLLFG
jgi:hypothetical protein